ncbi:TPA: transcriptional regulator [Escherichia coli]|uniref:transcriptional regulator n=1 Tax=Escherichia coli TaxID=562 RepID=UPI000BF8B979|nr:transcriptional regulator [Escherichia coli]EKD4648753.1 transcriptional regulator [Escherichia coli]ELB8938193.1 transcriptional regulator [Escherichia coli]ELY0355242.1 transcriptional regulator [Escherichia coli]MCS1254066.1 transcriptional regulator [Escherichia coli]MCS1281775.1 transcriptional regulator [Escherichia coli]
MENDIGRRLREERERLGLSQVAMSDMGGVKKLTQLRYEKGDSFPDAAYLAALSRFGLDVQYVVLGVHSPETYNNDEQELITRFRAASLDVKNAVIGALVAGSSASNNIKITGSGHRVAGRDYNEMKDK